jgi:D-beta-D-heptose 7-phosphate kinase/D-beta-D-heptose 1-phosphate adenosyltransferase
VEAHAQDRGVKVLSLERLLAALAPLRAAGGRVVFTNGCFDLLHVGHARYLAEARRQGDLLVVGLNSDSSMRAIKGERRPIVPQAERAELLAGLACVDFVTIFDQLDPLELIQALRPDVLVKGADWPEAQIVGADVVKAAGGRVVRVPLVDGASSSALIATIVRRYGVSPHPRDGEAASATEP